ncbi:MAG: class I SAM-dependent methyltransferase [Pyrinomonadaceae bacterium]
MNQMSNTKTAAEVKGISGKICLSVSKLFLNGGALKRFGFRKDEITRFDSMENYVADRVEQIGEYQELFSRFTSFEGKTVLELGCNKGYLINSFLQHENFHAIGAELDSEALKIARENYGDKIEFIQSTPNKIPLPDASIDVVYTIDTFEHLSQPNEILTECFRVLRPNGILFIHFGAWLTPYGSHLEDIIPIPWANAVFSMDTLLNVAAHLYDSPDYKTACYYIDQKTGERKPNPYLDKAKWDEFLNHITIRKFRKIINRLPFKIEHLENIGFGGKTFKLGRYLGKLSQLPGTEEFFTKATFAVLKKSASEK